jgi:sulfite exporter TauE/SafE
MVLTYYLLNQKFPVTIYMSLNLTNPYFDALTIGITYGLGICTGSCLPYLAGYVAGIGADFRQGIKVTFLFNAGRVLSYALIGAIAGLVVGILTSFAGTAVTPLQIYGSIIFGAVTIAIGVSLLLKARKNPQCSLHKAKPAAAKRKINRFGDDIGAFTLGLSRGLIICPPLAGLLLAYATLPFSSLLGSVTIASLFGVGTMVSPMLVLGGVTGWLLNKAPLFRKWISLAGGGILILLGVITIITSTSQIPT